MNRKPLDGLGESISETDDPSTRFVDLTPYYGHLGCFLGLAPLRIKTNRFTYAPSYPPNGRMQNTWLSIALDGIEALHSHCSAGNRATGLPDPWRKVAVIGTGNGLDAVGISRIAHPRTIVASDIHPGVLQAARWNIDRFLADGCEAIVRESDLFAAYPTGEAFDFIYENLPNVPDGKELFDGIRSASCYTPRARCERPACDRYLLTLHSDFLIEARSRLNDRGWVMSVIGGRMPVDVIHGMFHDAGYRSIVAGFGVKIQSEADVVLPAYGAAERETGISFAYYHPLDACISVLRDMPQPLEILAREAYARKLTERLDPFRISATEATRLHGRGERVCHTAYVIAARLIRNEGGRNGNEKTDG